jgi:hypothetical protein
MANYYQETLDYFLEDDDLQFRALVVADKAKLQHAAFGQDHDTWYYKMYFRLLEVLFSPNGRYRIYLEWLRPPGFPNGLESSFRTWWMRLPRM